jgi:glutathione peroxidase
MIRFESIDRSVRGHGAGCRAPPQGCHTGGQAARSRANGHNPGGSTTEETPMATIYDFEVSDIHGKEQKLSQFRDKVLLIVNTASKCGFTPQYKGLEALHRKLHPRGLEVLGFPCNQFGAQEPGDAKEIESFCEINYGVSFPLFAKIDVNGAKAAPLYRYLKKEKPGLLGSEAIKWNFTKFLVDRKGKVVERYAPNVEPAAIAGAIEQLL